MAQHDFNIANDYFPPLRADINNSLLAIVTNSAGTSAPTTTYPYQWWADQTTLLLKQRNGANTAWVTIMSLDTTNGGLATVTGVRTQINRNLVLNAFNSGTHSPLANNAWATINLDTSLALRSGDSFSGNAWTVGENGTYQIIAYCEHSTTGGTAPTDHTFLTSIGINTTTGESIRLSYIKTTYTSTACGNNSSAIVLLTAGQSVTYNYNYSPTGGAGFNSRIVGARFSVLRVSD